MKARPLLYFIFLFLFFISHIYTSRAQLSSGGVPVSNKYDLVLERSRIVTLTPPDMGKINKDDSLYPSPYGFGVVLPLNVTPEESGYWTELPDGSRIWRVIVAAPGALALTAYFDRFYIPEGGKLFLYNPGKSQVIGAFTSSNNTESGYFATELIAGDTLVLEYLDPKESLELPSIHLNEIAYAYRGVEFLEKYRYSEPASSNCEVNVNCPEGLYWQYQKDGVTRIQVKRDGRSFWCSGSLVNNTNQDKTPYILTANHCGYNSTPEELQSWIFYFNYESPGCTSSFPDPRSLTGAVLKAQSGTQLVSGSDFYLVQMNDIIPDSFHVFYNGWSRGVDNPSPSGVCIHHPGGAIKKISTYLTPLVSTNYEGSSSESHWKVLWSGTQSGHGVTEGGSSGSPIYDNLGRIVGTLTGGESACDSPYLNLPDYYGQFAYSWASNGNSPDRRLKDWLDPTATNTFILDGVYLGILETEKPKSVKVYPNPFDRILRIYPDQSFGEVKITLYDLPGRVVFTGHFQIQNKEPIELDPGPLQNGIYILKTESPSMIGIQKIIKQ